MTINDIRLISANIFFWGGGGSFPLPPPVDKTLHSQANTKVYLQVMQIHSSLKLIAYTQLVQATLLVHS